jgi:hypothetical protein
VETVWGCERVRSHVVGCNATRPAQAHVHLGCAFVFIFPRALELSRFRLLLCMGDGGACAGIEPVSAVNRHVPISMLSLH